MSSRLAGGLSGMQPIDLVQRVSFRATVHRAGVRVPRAAVRELAAGRRPFVRVTVGAHTYPARVAVRDGELRLPVPAAAGDEVEVVLELDTDARSAAVPSDLADALEAAPGALHRFESLPYDRQRRVVAAVEDAHSPERRERRIALAIERLRLVA